MARRIRALLVTAVAAMTIAAHGQTLRRVPVFRTGIYSYYVGPANIVLHNVYGPSVPEIVSCSEGNAFALTKSGTGYRPVWHSGNVNCSAVAVEDVNGDGHADVFVGTATDSSGTPGSVLVFSTDRVGRHRASVALPDTQQVTDVALGNVDGDPAPELVAISSTDAYVYDAATLVLEWTATGRGGTAVAIADLESNGMAEIIVNGPQGHVLDASTQTLKWGYVGGFGWHMAVGDVDADGKPEIVGAKTATITIFHGDTQTTSSFEVTGFYPSVDALAIGDGNNDGFVEIVTGDADDPWRKLHGWSITGQDLWYTDNPGYGVSGIAIGDPDGDGVNEVVWGASGTNGVFVGNTSTHAVEWQSSDLYGQVYANAADVDGDGELEILVVYQTGSGYDRGRLEVQNLNGEIEWGVYIVGSLFSETQSPIPGQFDSDPALEILVIGAGRLYVYDGVTHALEWSSSSDGYEAVIAANIDADPVWEIIVGSSDRRVQILNGATNFVQGSVTLDNSVFDLALADVNADASLDLVVGTYSSFYVLKASDLSVRHHNTAMRGFRVAARTGEYAVSSISELTVFSGATNAEQWRCTRHPSSRLRYVTLYGMPVLAASTAETQIDFYPGGATSCPVPSSLEHPGWSLVDFDFLDISGDGMPELILAGWGGAEIDLIASAAAPRGDADGDGLVLDSDLHALSEYLYGDGTLPRAGADATGDFSVHPEDLFYLINYRKGTGAPPP
jgi:hypothetical protein